MLKEKIFYIFVMFLVLPDNIQEEKSSFFNFQYTFVFRCVRISIRGLVRRSVGWLVGPSVRNAFVKIDEKWTLRILNDLGSAGQGKKRDKEAGGTRRKEGRGGRRDREEGGMGRKEGRRE